MSQLHRQAATPPILLWDVMSTLVYDPFRVELPEFFGMSFEAMMQDKDPHAWPAFERGELSAQEFARRFFEDRRPVDAQGLEAALLRAYRFEPGMEALLEELSAAKVVMHTLSNYPVWWRLIEQKLHLSRFMPWTFVSCEHGVRKPDAQAYERAAALAGAQAWGCIFIDDRGSNCRAAAALGMTAICHRDAAQTRAALAEHLPALREADAPPQRG